MSTARFLGIVLFSASLHAQLPVADSLGVNREFPSYATTGPTTGPTTGAPALTAAGGIAGTQRNYSFGLSGTEQALDFPERSPNEPISGVVSLRELTHPISKKAMRAAYEAQKSAQAGDLPGAIAKLEKAIRIDPAYRDAHLNLGVQYARVRRYSDARAEFQKSLDIGPPASPIYMDLALISLTSRQYREAETFSRKALELDPANRGAQRVLMYASQFRSEAAIR